MYLISDIFWKKGASQDDQRYGDVEMFARVISVNGWLFYVKVANLIMRKE